MMEKEDIIYHLIMTGVALCKELIKDLNEFYPVCFGYVDEKITSITIDEEDLNVEDYLLALYEGLTLNNIKTFVIIKNIALKNENLELDAFELNLVVESIKYQPYFMTYSRQEDGTIEYSELFTMND